MREGLSELHQHRSAAVRSDSSVRRRVMVATHQHEPICETITLSPLASMSTCPRLSVSLWIRRSCLTVRVKYTKITIHSHALVNQSKILVTPPTCISIIVTFTTSLCASTSLQTISRSTVCTLELKQAYTKN